MGSCEVECGVRVSNSNAWNPSLAALRNATGSSGDLMCDRESATWSDARLESGNERSGEVIAAVEGESLKTLRGEEGKSEHGAGGGRSVKEFM